MFEVLKMYFLALYTYEQCTSHADCRCFKAAMKARRAMWEKTDRKVEAGEINYRTGFRVFGPMSHYSMMLDESINKKVYRRGSTCKSV